jgi:hypothetical protein
VKNKPDATRQAEVVDVQLLAVLPQVEAVLPHARELQRAARRGRDVPSQIAATEGRAAGTAIVIGSIRCRQTASRCAMS